jgi:hypothetical protein
MSYRALLTIAGQEKIAVFAAGGPRVPLTHVAIGNANGAPYDPVETQTVLVGERYRAPIAAQGATTGGVISIEADIPADTTDVQGRPSHGWNVHELGVFASDGTLFAVARMNGGYKPSPSSGQAETLTLQIRLDVGNAAAVTVVIDPTALTPISRLMRAPFISVDGVQSAPPDPAVTGSLYAVSSGSSGAWAGRGGWLAERAGTSWQFIQPPQYSIVRTTAGAFWERAASDWQAAVFPFDLPPRLGAGSQMVTDWNSAVDNGYYFADGAALNAPQGGYLQGHVTASSGWTDQYLWPLTATSPTDFPVWHRKSTPNTAPPVWGVWRRLSWLQAEQDARFAALLHSHPISAVTGLQAALDGKQALLGFTPVQQGGGAGGQLTNKINIGHSAGGPRLAVDGTDYGPFSFAGHLHDAAAITTGTLPEGRVPARLGLGAALVADWGAINSNGWFYGENAANAPVPGYVIGTNWSAGGWNHQIVTSLTSNTATSVPVWYRYGGGAVWSAWVRLSWLQTEQDQRYRQTRDLVAYQSAGSYTFTVPANVSAVLVEVVGGGGGGAGALVGLASGGGGGAGGYASGWVSGLAVGQTFTVIVGAGGAGGAGTNGAVGGAGGTSSFGALMSATGGGGGGTLGSAAPGGNGGVGAGGQIQRAGGYGVDGKSNAAVGISGAMAIDGGAGGPSAFGGGGRAGTLGGVAGQAPGSGGGAAYLNTGNGGAGAAGAVIVRY